MNKIDEHILKNLIQKMFSLRSNQKNKTHLLQQI